jgi:hypothetical protein
MGEGAHRTRGQIVLTAARIDEQLRRALSSVPGTTASSCRPISARPA